MNDDGPVDIAALTALCQAHKGHLPWRADNHGLDPILDAIGNSIVNVDQACDASLVEMGEDDRQYIIAACNALPELLAMLAAAQEGETTWHNAFDRQLTEYNAFRLDAQETLDKVNAHILQQVAARIAALEADRDHARAWAKYWRNATIDDSYLVHAGPPEEATDGWNGIGPRNVHGIVAELAEYESTSTAGGECRHSI